MLHLRYSAEFWICFNFRIYQSYEYTRVKEYRVTQKFLNKIFHENSLNFEYGRVLNMLGWHMVLNKVLHHRCLTLLCVCLEFWIYQIYHICRKRSIIHVWRGSEYSSGFQHARTWICKGCKYTKVIQGLG